jgi:hypothetical protein
MSTFSPKTDICYACGKEIIERELPPAMLEAERQKGNYVNSKVGKFQIQRLYFDDNWKAQRENIYFHESCYFTGFCEAIKRGYNQ